MYSMEERRMMRTARVENVVHNVIMESRKKLSVSGVEDVESFNESEIILHTNMGVLVVCGMGLHINKLTIDNGEVMIDGEVSELRYAAQSENSGGFLKRLFK